MKKSGKTPLFSENKSGAFKQYSIAETAKRVEKISDAVRMKSRENNTTVPKRLERNWCNFNKNAVRRIVNIANDCIRNTFF